MQIRDTAAAEAHRWLLVVAVGASALVYGPRGGLEAGSAAKTSVVLVAGLVALLIAAAVAVRDRSASLPWHPATGLAVAFGLALVGRALVSDAPAVAFAGPLGRANGAGLYLACIVLFLVAAARSDPRTWAFLAHTAVVVGAIVALSAVDEATVRLGPNWGDRPGVAGTLGNANFLAGWSGTVLPLTLVIALDPRRGQRWRVAAAVVSVLLVVAAGLSGSLQGGYVIGGVIAVVGLVWTSERLPVQRWRVLAGSIAGLAVVGGVLTVLGAAGNGPLAALRGSIGVRLRAEYWVAASRMWADAPLTGIGPGQFVDRYRQVRTPEAATLVSLESSTDSAHNVPLHLAAEGGIVIGLLHVAFLVLVAVALVQALRATSGPERLWIGAFGAAWVGYVLQSLISIDVAPLAVLGWTLGGIVVGAAARSRAFGAAPRKRSVPLPRPVVAAQVLAAVVLVVFGLVGGWAATFPYRVDAASANSEVENRRTPEGRTATTRAVEMAPWREAYRLQLVRALDAAGRSDRAEGVVRDALEVNPNSFEAVVNGARLARAAGELEVATTRYERALSLDPWHPDLAVEVAQFSVRTGDMDRALELAEAALAVDPDHPGALEIVELL